MKELQITEAEMYLMKSLRDLWDDYYRLPEQHPMARSEFFRLIRDAQHHIAARPAMRMLYDGALITPRSPDTSEDGVRVLLCFHLWDADGERCEKCGARRHPDDALSGERGDVNEDR